MAARVLRGRRVASGVRLLVAPASLQRPGDGARRGTLAALLDAGGKLLPNGAARAPATASSGSARARS